MPTTTTTTRIRALNSVLQSVGERSASSFDEDDTSLKALDAMRDALSEISVADSWLWLFRRANPDSWLAEIATVNGITKLSNVEWGATEVGHYPIQYIRTIDFYKRPNIGTPDPNVRSQFWTYTSDATIAFNPYPTSLEGQNRIWVQYYTTLDLPALDTDVFQCPENIIPLIVYKASSILALRLSAEINVAQNLDAQYRIQLQQLRGMQRTTDYNLNMYR